MAKYKVKLLMTLSRNIIRVAGGCGADVFRVFVLFGNLHPFTRSQKIC